MEVNKFNFLIERGKSPGAVQAESISSNTDDSGIAGLATIEPFGEFTELLFIFEFNQILELRANKF
jgi:hypothetical protein